MLKELMELQNPYLNHEFYDAFPSFVLWHFSSKVIRQGPLSAVIEKNTANRLSSVLSVS